MIELRDYQREAVDAALGAWAGGLQRPAEVLPTGAGKTVVFAEVLRRAALEQGGRSLVLAHRTELITQAAGKLRDVAPELRVGVVKAGRNETLAPVVVGSVQTLASDFRRRQLYDVRRVIVDEAHHATAASYVKTLQHFGCFESGGAVALGVTATMSRGDTKALGDVWQDIVFERPISWMISRRWLVRPRGVRVAIAELDMSRVKTSRGDYAVGDLGRALEDSLAPEAVAKAMIEHVPPGTRPTLLFAPTVRVTELFAEALTDAGYGVRVVTGEMPAQERAQALEDFRNGKVQVLCNCMVLTEGTDLPLASCVVIARPTRHAGLYVQMVGRVLRPWPGKDDALVLDVVGASKRHGLVGHVELFGEAAAREQDDEESVEVADEEITLDDVGAALDEPSWTNGPLVSEEVDLFHGSKSAWLRTHAGVWFLPLGDWFLAIVRAQAYGHPGWTVVRLHKSVARMADSRFVTREPVSDLSYAMAYAEADVTHDEATYTRKARAWRRQSPTEPQTRFAAQFGIDTTGMTKGEVASLLSVEVATRRIDPYLRPGMV